MMTSRFVVQLWGLGNSQFWKSISLGTKINIQFFRGKNVEKFEIETCLCLMQEVSMTSWNSFWCFYCWLWTDFTQISSISTVEFEQVNVTRDWNLPKPLMINAPVIKKPVSFYMRVIFGTKYSSMVQVKFAEDSL